MSHKLIKRKINCGVCGAELEIKKNFVFRCNKQPRGALKQKKATLQPCNFYQSALKHTWFSRTHLSIKEILTLSILWAQNGSTLSECKREVSCSTKTVIERLALCRQVAFDYCVKNSVKVGGVGKVVELYEAQFGWHKNKTGKVRDSTVWTIGGVERGSQNFFLTTVDNLEEETVIKNVLENVLPNTHITINSCNFEVLTYYGFQLSPLEDSDKLVNVASSSITSNFKKRSQEEQQVGISTSSKKQIKSGGFLAENLFKWRFPDEGERFHAFLHHVAQMYFP